MIKIISIGGSKLSTVSFSNEPINFGDWLSTLEIEFKLKTRKPKALESHKASISRKSEQLQDVGP